MEPPVVIVLTTKLFAGWIVRLELLINNNTQILIAYVLSLRTGCSALLGLRVMCLR